MKRVRWLALALAVFLITFWLKDAVVSSAMTAATSAMLGAPVSLESSRWNPLAQTLSLKGLRIRQPEGFGPGALVEIPRAFIRYDTASWLSGRPRFFLVEVDVRQVVIVRDSDGSLNVDALKISRKTKPPGSADAGGQPMKVDELRLSLGRVIQKDLTRPDRPRIEVRTIGLRDATYRDLPSPAQVVGVILGQSLKAAAVQGALIYGTAAVAGVSFLPVGAAFVLTGKDDDLQTFRAAKPRVFAAALSALKTLGEAREQNARSGTLSGSVDGCSVQIELSPDGAQTRARVSARRYLIPQPGVAAAVLYLIEETLS